jgi:hypothetical protein
MKTYIDLHKVKRRSLISNLTSVGGLMLLLGGVIVPLFLPALHQEAQVLMVVGMGVAMVGIYLANRWVRKPRPEESLDSALKSLNNSYHLFHYPSLPCDHILLTPSGIVIIEVFNLAGNFTYKDGRWKEKMSVGRALRYIVEEHLGDPVKNARELEEYLRGRLNQALGNDHSISIHSVVTFTHPAVRLDVRKSPIPVCKLDKLNRNISWKTSKLDTILYNKLDAFLISLTANREKS